MNECGCGRPAQDQYVCDECGNDLAKDLKELVATLDEELETCIAGTKGVDWRNGAPRGGGEAGLRINWRATEVYRRLHRALSEAVDHCVKVNTRHSSTTDDAPAATVPSMALWLTWRIDGLTLDPAGPRHIAGISKLVDKAKAIVEWEPPQQRFMGGCGVCGQGYLYAEGEADEAMCDRCERAFPAEAARSAMISELDDRIFTAVEIGKLSTYLSLNMDRERVRAKVGMWGTRKLIETRSGDGETAKYRFGDVRLRLMAEDAS